MRITKTLSNRCFFALLAGLYSSVPMNVFAQPNYSIQHYTTENGLPQNSVLDIAVDKQGFTWLATENGMVRFDGQQFRNFNLNNTPVLKNSDRMRMVLADTNGTIMFRTSFLDLFEIKNNHQIVSISKVFNEKIIAEKASLINQKDFLPAFSKLKKANPDLFLEFFQQSAYKINKDEIYVWADFTAVCFLKKNGEAKKLTSFKVDQGFILNDTCFSVAEAGFFTAFYKDQPPVNIALAGDILNDPLYNPHLKNIRIVGHAGETVIILGTSYYTVSQKRGMLHTTLLFSNMILNNVSCIKYDPYNNHYCIGTSSDGFYIVKARQFRNILQQEKNTAERFENVFSHQMLLGDDKILADGGRLIDKAGKVTVHEPILFSAPYNDRYGFNWYETNGFIVKTDSNLNKLLQIKIQDIAVGFIRQDSVSQNIWQTSWKRIFRIKEQDLTLQDLSFVLPNEEDITCLNTIDSSHFLVGTNNGLYLLQLKPYKFWKIKGSEKKIVRYIFQDKQNGIDWICTYGQGLFYIKDGQFLKLPMDKNGKLLTPHCIISDNRGFFWIPTNNGIFQVLRKDLVNYANGGKENIFYQVHGSDEGFASNEFNGGSNTPFIRRKDGLVSLPSMKGLVWFYPDSMAANPPNSRVFIDRLTLDNVDTIFAGEVKLPNNYTQLVVAVATTYYGNKENLNVEYQIKGLSEGWNQLPANRLITLLKLQRGRYTLIVRKQAFFSNQYEYAELSFKVLPAWYESIWFYIVCGFAGIATIALLLRWRLDSLLARKKELERQVTTRTALLKQTVENYETANNELADARQQLLDADKIKEQIISIILHDLWSPLNFMCTTAAHMANKADQYSPQEMLTFINAVNSSASNITSLTGELMKWLRSQKGGFSPDIKKVRLQEIFEEIVKLYKEIVAHKGTQITIDNPTDMVATTDATVLTLIIRNLVDNANKNTKNGFITLSAGMDLQTNHALVTITDSGNGMPEKTISEILALKNKPDFTSRSLGFRFVFDFAKTIHAEIDIEKGRKTGTAIQISLPVMPVKTPLVVPPEPVKKPVF